MKNKQIIALLLSALVILPGCGNTTPPAEEPFSEDTNSENEDTAQNVTDKDAVTSNLETESDTERETEPEPEPEPIPALEPEDLGGYVFRIQNSKSHLKGIRKCKVQQPLKMR